MSHVYPGNFARFYDTIYHTLRDGVDNDFFLHQIKQAKGQVLEIGAGTGRFFTEALHAEADIYGIDISTAMIEILRGKLAEEKQYRISEQSMVDFEFPFQFDLIVAPFRVFMHILEKEDQLRALDNIYHHLRPGGRFIFDTFVPDLNQLIEGINDVTDFEGEYEPGKWLRRRVTTRPDLINQLIHIEFHLEWEEVGHRMEEKWALPLRFFFRYELEHLIERSPFDNYQILGDYAGNQLDKNSKEFILVCDKV